jgi:sulfur carrier protein
MTRVEVNGVSRALAAGTTVSDVVATVVPDESGCAVAVNGEVVPRRQWPAHVLDDGDRVEVLTAVQGG